MCSAVCNILPIILYVVIRYVFKAHGIGNILSVLSVMDMSASYISAHKVFATTLHLSAAFLYPTKLIRLFCVKRVVCELNKVK